MCELFAMSADRPTNAGPYLARLMPRGGKTGPHADGWGVACYEDRAARIFKDKMPAAESRIFSLLAEHGIESNTVVAHIRRANPSIFGRSTGNTHPFERELNGRSWVFAHNGKLPDIRPPVRSRFNPAGETDSEKAFCFVLNAVAHAINRHRWPSPATMTAAIRPVVAGLAALGEFNFILSNGEYVYVHAHTRLHALKKAFLDSAGSCKMTLLATVPLTDEPWAVLEPSSLSVYRDGECLLQERNVSPRVRPQPTPMLSQLPRAV